MIYIEEKAFQTVIWKMATILFMPHCVNTLRLRQDGRRFLDDTFELIFLNINVIIFIKISLKFVPIGPINNIPALVQIMAWRQPGDKSLSEPMMLDYRCIYESLGPIVLWCGLHFLQWYTLMVPAHCLQALNSHLFVFFLTMLLNCYSALHQR